MSDVQKFALSPASAADGRSRAEITQGVKTECKRAWRSLAVSVALIGGDLIASVSALAAVRLLISFTEFGATKPIAPHLPVQALVLVFLALGLYSGSSRSPYVRFRARAVGVLLFATLDAVVMGRPGGPALLFLTAASKTVTLFTAGFYVEFLIRQLLIHYGFWTVPTALVGTGETAQQLYRSLNADPELGFKPIGFLLTPDDAGKNHSTLPAPVLGTIEEFARLGGPAEVAIMTSRKHLAIAHAISDRLPPARLILVTDAQDIQTLWLRTRELGHAVGLQFERDPFLRQNRVLKRLIDLIIAIPIAILSLPLIASLAVLIWVVDRGSPFYVQRCVDGRGRQVRIFRLRTMHKDSTRRLEEYLARNPMARAEWNRYFKLSEDPRILPGIGGFIHGAGLNELPQLWSVIIGDMSLVGPRPLPAYQMNSFDAEFQRIRSLVPLGLTGLWQVTAGSSGDPSVQKAQDLTYIRNWSVVLDLYILFQTLPAILMAKDVK
jgi:lipopolysaccharide/colanic/teichoic acid biosynthesis glycosyltransferase